MQKFLASLLLVLYTLPLFAAPQRTLDADIINGVDTFKNHLGANGNLEKNIGQWASYSDAAAIIPVDGTGGTATLTCTRTTTNALRGNGSLLITKTAANLQGQGCSVPFTIDRADRGKMLRINYEYEVASGTYTDQSLRFYIYDTTNSRLIEPSASYVKASTTNETGQPVEFQSSVDSTNYRLIIHTAGTDALAYTIKLDDMKVSRQATPRGPPVSDWTTYTPTGTWSTNTTWTGKYRRVGDTLEVYGHVALTGAPNAVAFQVYLPPGLSIDSTKLPTTNTTTTFGSALSNIGGAQYPANLRMNGTTALSGINMGAGGSYVNEPTLLSYNDPGVFGSGSYVTFWYRVPIAGWSSGTAVSSNDDGRQIEASFTSAGGGTLSTNTVVVYGNKLYDTHGICNVSTGLCTAPVAGYYNISASIETNSVAYGLAQHYSLRLFVNSVAQNYLALNYTKAAVTSALALNGTLKRYLNAGDTFQIKFEHSLSNNPVHASNTQTSWLMISRDIGTGQIAASESVYAQYYLATGTTGTLATPEATNTILNFDTKVTDSHGAVTTGGAWKFTAPVAGQYKVCGMIQANSSTVWAVGKYLGLNIYKNGTRIKYIAINGATGTYTTHSTATGCGDIRLNQGDYVDLRGENGTPNSITLAANYLVNWIDIVKIAN